MASSLDPIVLRAADIEEFIQYVIDHHASPSTVIVCSSKAAFLEMLQRQPTSTHQATGGEDEGAQLAHQGTRLWQTPTLRLLSTARTVNLAFCPDITHLRAYLATYTTKIFPRDQEGDVALRLPDAVPILALVNPIQLHRPTSAFSAQGINRTFAAAVEAAHHTGSKLILSECPIPAQPTLEGLSYDVSPMPATDPWEEEVPILNATTKRLGELSVGRTVKMRTIAERWCTIQSTTADILRS